MISRFSRRVARLTALVGLAVAICWPAVIPASKREPHVQAPTIVSPSNQVVLEDFSDIVTRVDLGFNDFSGNSGTLNKDDREYSTSMLTVRLLRPAPCASPGTSLSFPIQKPSAVA